MKSKLWVFRDIDPLSGPRWPRPSRFLPATASLLLARGVTTPDEATTWMSHQLPHDPFLIPDMEQAVERLHRAVTTQEPICFYGDYDVDGMSATSLYLSFFGARAPTCVAYVPHRVREGYGLNLGAVQRLHDEGISLLVTSDCGTTSHHEIALANQLGMDVIVTDHHQTDEQMPPAVAVMNPHRAGARYPFRGLCSAGLAYKVAQAYRAALRPGRRAVGVAAGSGGAWRPLPTWCRCRMRIGGLSERALCKSRAARAAAFGRLKQVAGVTRDCTAETIAFKLGAAA